HDTTRRLKIAIESYAEDQYDIALQAQQKADMDTFLVEVRDEQIRLEVLNKPDAVIM
ncbi:GIP, partial [Symbiodinium sp. KB8]